MQILKLFAADPLGPKVRTMSMKERERLFFLMAQMVRSGQTAEASLRTVAKSFKLEKKEEIANGLTSIAQKVAQGRTLSKAMESEYIMFSDIHRAAILAGEASNNLYKAFSMLQELEVKQMLAQRSGLAEVITPMAMLVLSLCSVFNTGLNTLPAMSKIKIAQGKPIGVIPETIMTLTQFLAANWYMIVAVLVITLIVSYSFIRTPQGRYWVDYYLLRVPFYGKYAAYKVYSSMLLYFPNLIASGVKPKQMIPIMEALATNMVLRRRIDLFNQVLTTGGQMSDAMDKAGFPPIAVTPVRVAENYSGNERGVNDAMVDGMTHAYTILDRDLSDTQRQFVTVISTILWLLGGCVMMMEMLSIILLQS